MPGGVVPALSPRPPVQPAPSPRLGEPGHREAAATLQLPAAPSRRQPLLSIPVAVHAAGRPLVATTVRPGPQPESLRGQIRFASSRRAPCLLLLDAHALCLAPALGLPG